ncbi:MAG: hypothetical protein ABL962_13165 [Fimbriimonadaceae bacterium]
MRKSLLLSVFLAVPAFSLGAWAPVILHPAGTSASYCFSASGVNQVGYALYGGYHAGFWNGTAASWVDLNPATATSSQAFGCTSNQQVGAAIVSGLQRASLWTGTAASWVNLSPVGMAPSVAYSILGNSQGGYVTVGGEKHAALWSGGPASFVDMHPSGYAESVIVGISNADQVGYVQAAGINYAARWTGTAASFVNLHPTGATGSSIRSSHGGFQVGQATMIGGDTHAIRWSGTAASAVDLHPAGANLSSALACYNNYQAGYVIQGSSNRAVLWNGTAASMVDLHATLPASYQYSFATGIGFDGTKMYIAGYAQDGISGQTVAVMWVESDPNSFTLSLNKSVVAGQNSVLGTITSQANPAARVYTTYDNSSLVTTPPTVTLAANTTTKTFQITTLAVNSSINTTIFAKRGAITRSQPLTLAPLIPTALSFTPSQVTGGQSTSCKVVINGVAGPGGRVIAILDNSPNATVPSTVTVPAGATNVTFNITTTAVTSQKIVTVTARVSAGEKTGTFRINP